MESLLSIEFFSQLIDWGGIAIILFGIIFASFKFIINWTTSNQFSGAYVSYRRNIARIILLGLEFLIAGDIIQSVAETPTLEKVIVLAVIVVIRTVLSIELQIEIDGKLPWARNKTKPEI